VPDFGQTDDKTYLEQEKNIPAQGGSPDAGESTDAQSRFEDTDSKVNFT
jgi:hypothetical protein